MDDWCKIQNISTINVANLVDREHFLISKDQNKVSTLIAPWV